MNATLRIGRLIPQQQRILSLSTWSITKNTRLWVQKGYPQKPQRKNRPRLQSCLGVYFLTQSHPCFCFFVKPTKKSQRKSSLEGVSPSDLRHFASSICRSASRLILPRTKRKAVGQIKMEIKTCSHKTTRPKRGPCVDFSILPNKKMKKSWVFQGFCQFFKMFPFTNPFFWGVPGRSQL